MGKSKLNKDLVKKAVRMYVGGMSKKEIAEELGVVQSTLTNWSKYDLWDQEVVLAKAEKFEELNAKQKKKPTISKPAADPYATDKVEVDEDGNVRTVEVVQGDNYQAGLREKKLRELQSYYNRVQELLNRELYAAESIQKIVQGGLDEVNASDMTKLEKNEELAKAVMPNFQQCSIISEKLMRKFDKLYSVSRVLEALDAQ